jgi:hypothetical protein
MFQLDQVVPWGRSFNEYVRMFALGEAELRLRIMGCADGPASFNAEATRRQMKVTSVDPLYRFDSGTIRDRIAATSRQITEQTRRNMDQFVWTSFQSVEELEQVRLKAMETFLEDYDLGKHQGRYVEAELPSLPFPDQSFDLAVCSHFLFLYTGHLPGGFHRQAIIELCRVAAEVRIFPLLNLAARPSPYVDELAVELRETHISSIETVPYEFQRGGNQMLRIHARESQDVPKRVSC